MLCSGLSYLLALLVCLAPVAGLVPQMPLNNATMAAAIMPTGDSGAVVAKFVAPEKIKLGPQGATVMIELTERASAAILQAAQGTGVGRDSGRRGKNVWNFSYPFKLLSGI